MGSEGLALDSTLTTVMVPGDAILFSGPRPAAEGSEWRMDREWESAATTDAFCSRAHRMGGRGRGHAEAYIRDCCVRPLKSRVLQ